MRHFLLAVALLVPAAQAANTPDTQAPAAPPSIQPAESMPTAPAQPPAPEKHEEKKEQKPDPDAVKSAMAASIAKQRTAVIQQVATVMNKQPTPAASFFTVPWVETPVPFNMPPCDPLPTVELDKLVQESSAEQGIKADLIRAVIAEESGARPCAVSWKGAQGLMQLMPATAQELGVQNPFDPRQNVQGGTRLLKQLLTKYKNDVTLALAAYNAGESRVDRDGGVPSIPETQNYVNDIQNKLPKK